LSFLFTSLSSFCNYNTIILGKLQDVILHKSRSENLWILPIDKIAALGEPKTRRARWKLFPTLG